MLPFSSGNTIGSGVFPDSNTAGMKVDRNVASIWSNPTAGSDPRSQPMRGAADHRQTWGSYQAQQHSAAGAMPEYQSWGYQAQHGAHMRESHSVWGSSDHDQAWKYTRPQGPPPSGGVWQYPGSSAAPDYHHDWNARASSQQVAAVAAAGYYYVPHDQRSGEEYGIPYDIGARRSYQAATGHMMGAANPSGPGYPMPAHMQYYGAQSAQPTGAGVTSASQPSPTVVIDSVNSPQPPPAPAASKGAASFLFEAAAASSPPAAPSPAPPMAPSAMAGAPAGGPAVSIMDAAAEVPAASVPANRRRDSPGKRSGPVAGSSGGVNSRVNNHQLRLHSSGNEKAPLSSTPLGNGGAVTTLMIRNIPNRYTQSELLMEIKEAGFDNKFDFFYLPMDHETHANFGYAFINFVDDREVDPFTKRFNGLKLNRFTSNKIIQIVPAQLQGFQANLQHYCKKAVCTDDNIDYRPLFFVDGKCLEFHRAAEFGESTSPKPSDAPAASAPRPASNAGRGNGQQGARGGKGSQHGGRRGDGVFQRKSRDE